MMVASQRFDADPLITSDSLLKALAHVGVPRTAKFIEKSPT